MVPRSGLLSSTILKIPDSKSSSGTLISAALKYCKEQEKVKNVVTFVCDNGEKYLNTAYNKLWLKEKNLI